MVLKTGYLVDECGEKKSVVLSLEDYLRLMEYLEDLEDSADLKKAKDTARDFKDFAAVVQQLKARGRMR